MKLTRFTLSLTLIIGTLALAGVVFAGPGGGGPEGFDRGGDLGMLHRITRMANRIDLSDEQVAQIESILEAAKPEAESLRTQLREGMETFRESHEPGQFDEASARAFAEAHAAIRVDLMVHEMKTRASVMAMLTPEQIEELQTLREERGEKAGRRGRGGRRGR